MSVLNGPDEGSWSVFAEKVAAERDDAEAKLASIGQLLAQNGCDCSCDHHADEHNNDCALCLACRIGHVLQPVEQAAVGKEEQEIAFNQEWHRAGDSNDATWRIVGIKPDMITLSGPGICRSVRCVSPDELLKKWVIV